MQLLVDDPALAATIYIKTPYLYRRPAKLPLTYDREAAPKLRLLHVTDYVQGRPVRLYKSFSYKSGARGNLAIDRWSKLIDLITWKTLYRLLKRS